jgi:hypothetical protein
MTNLLSTGRAAQFLGTTEPRLADLVRKGKIHPPPEIFAGRRLWEGSQILCAAQHLGLLTSELRSKLVELVAATSHGGEGANRG